MTLQQNPVQPITSLFEVEFLNWPKWDEPELYTGTVKRNYKSYRFILAHNSPLVTNYQDAPWYTLGQCELGLSHASNMLSIQGYLVYFY